MNDNRDDECAERLQALALEREQPQEQHTEGDRLSGIVHGHDDHEIRNRDRKADPRKRLATHAS